MTLPFSATLEAALKQKIQGGKLRVYEDIIVSPEFHCCLSGLNVPKDPVAVMGVSPTRVCTATNVSVDYSHSYSPSSTIATWEIDWGDGNTTGAAWPGAGSSNHPAGGYTLPGYYTITLTVIDLLGAYGYAQQQVEVIDCTLPEIEIFGGCGDSGVWKTETAGISWDASGLDGILIRDLKPTWFSIGTEVIELWAATENGLYHTVDSGVTWGRVTLPLPAGYETSTLSVIALTCSKFDPAEVYVLTEIAAVNHMWIYRTTDRGVTWDAAGGGTGPLEVGNITWEEVSGGANAAVYDIVVVGDYLYACGAFTVIGGVAANYIARYDGFNWASIGGGFIGTLYKMDVTNNGIIYVAEGDGLDCAVHYYNPISGHWSSLPTTTGGIAPAGPSHFCPAVSPLNTSVSVAFMRTFAATGPQMYVWDQSNSTWVDTCGSFASDPRITMYTLDGLEVYVGGSFPGAPAYLRRHIVGGACGAVVGGQPDNAVWDIDRDPVTGAMYFVGAFHNIGGITAWALAKYQYGVWTRPDPTNYGTIYSIKVYNSKNIYWGSAAGSIVKFDEDNGKVFLLGTANSSVYAIVRYKGQVYASGSFTSVDGTPADYIARTTTYMEPQPTDSHFNMMDMSADGEYVYVAGINAASHPVVIRVAYDLSGFDVVLNKTASGTYAGVAADPYDAGIVWVYGDMSVSEKVDVSNDWGGTWTDVTDAGWAAAEVICPLLISWWEPSDAVVILNNALEVWQTKDWGITWVETGATTFVAQCGVRDPFEPFNIWIGRTAPGGADHIQYSPNEGISWIEHSGGFEAGAPVTALAVTN